MSSYFNIDSKNEREFAPYITTNPDENVVEGYTANDFSELVNNMSAKKFYDMSSNLLYNPSDPEYIPSVREAAIEDRNQLIVQQNTMFALSAMSAVSVAVLLYMISNRG